MNCFALFRFKPSWITSYQTLHDSRSAQTWCSDLRVLCSVLYYIFRKYKFRALGNSEKRNTDTLYWHWLINVLMKLPAPYHFVVCEFFLVENLLLRDDFRRCLAPKELSVVIGYPVSSVHNSSFYFSARFTWIKLNLHFVRLEGSHCQNSKIFCSQLCDCPESVRIIS